MTEIIIAPPPASSKPKKSGPPKPGRTARIMLWLIVTMVVSLLTWATFAQVDEVAQAQGRVIPSRQLQIVSNLEGGIVKEILVRQGNIVWKGQPLIRLDTTQFSSQLLKDQGSYNALIAKIARLEAEVAGTPLRFDDELILAAPEIVNAEQSLYDARQNNFNSELSAVQAKLEQARRMQGQATVEAATKGQARTFAEKEVAMLAPLVEMGIEPQISLLRARSEAQRTSGEYQAALLAVERAKSAVAEAESDVKSLRDQYRAKAFEDLTTAKTDLAGTGRDLPALEDRVQRAELRAPVAGIVNRVLVSTVGGVVKPGEPLIEIVPQNDSLVIEALLKPSDIASIHPGQKALIKLTAYNYAIYGGLDGRVEYISPDAVMDEKRNGESHYIVRIRAENQLKKLGNKQLSITPGMVADVNILGEKRSILSYILTPITRVKDNAFRER
jgi:adhesin transport system membrane fusion protein